MSVAPKLKDPHEQALEREVRRLRVDLAKRDAEVLHWRIRAEVAEGLILAFGEQAERS